MRGYSFLATGTLESKEAASGGIKVMAVVTVFVCEEPGCAWRVVCEGSLFRYELTELWYQQRVRRRYPVWTFWRCRDIAEGWHSAHELRIHDDSWTDDHLWERR